MTNEQAIKHLKLMQSGARNAIRHARNDKEISEEERKEDVEIYQDQLEALTVAIKALEQKPTQRWIPIITREPTEEEKKDYFEQNGEELCYMIDSPMPDNGQEVLVSVGDTVGEDIFDEDFWNFEGWDIGDVEAWMPMPKPYAEKRGNENESRR